MDLSSIISTRLKAMRKLQENPKDMDAMDQIQTAETEVIVITSCNFYPNFYSDLTSAVRLDQNVG